MLFRNRRLVRAIACCLLLQTINSIAFPFVSFAMTGPSQPEFTSYEAPGASDLVNLVTGDFTYSLPIIDIPGPERSFSLPLTYKAGIQLEQEASWVGLGWTLNAGAIARMVNGYPDDANNEPVHTTFDKKVDRGWTASFAGLVNLGWNSITGHNGSVDLIGLASVGWDQNGVNQGDVVGIGYTAGKGFGVDPVRMVTAVVTIATLGGGSVAEIAAQEGIGLATNVALEAAIGALGIGRLGGVAGYNNNPTRSISSNWPVTNYWDFYHDNSTENAYGSLYFGKMSQNTQNTNQIMNYNDYSYSNYDSPPPIKYGAQVPVGSTAKLFSYVHDVSDSGNTFSEVAADVYQDATVWDKFPVITYNPGEIPDPGAEDGENNDKISSRPISIAHDYFSVMGEAATGSIRPYRLDVGSIAYPKQEANVLKDYSNNTTTLLLPHYKHMAIPFLDTKVGFRYEGNLSNGYDYHHYTPTGTDDPTGFTFSSDGSSITVTDPSLLAGTRTGATRKGLYDGSTGGSPRLVQGKNVTWYSNAEINAMYASSTDGAGTGFLEFEHPQAIQVAGSTLHNYFRTNLPPSGIGAFAVTTEDGTTYHYSLPVYQYKTYSETNEVQTASTVGDPGKMTRTTGGSTSTNLSGAQATTWLLTAITSADYIDRNGSGTVDAGDWGGWVKFSYGKFSPHYKWRQPYIGTSYTDEQATIVNRSFTEGYKETYYLNSVATRTHTALFVKSVRQDGRGHFRAGVTSTNSNLGIDERHPSSSLRLDEIILLDNATLAKAQTADGIRASTDPTPVPALTTTTGSNLGTYSDDPMSYSEDDMTSVLDIHDISADSRIKDFINASAIKRVHFNYDYDLCQSTPNSFICQNSQPASLPDMTEAGMAVGRGGKLTLKSVSFYGPTVNGTPTKIIPDFTFSYDPANATNIQDTNPAYGKEKWDAFGMYQPYGKADVSSHVPYGYGTAAPWTLTKITSPLGGTTEIQYERDQYAHVSEFGTRKVHLSNSNTSTTFDVSYPNGSVAGLSALFTVGQTIYLTGKVRYEDCVIHYNHGDVTNNVDHEYRHKPFTITAVDVANSQISISPGFTPSYQCHDPNGNITSSTQLGADFDVAVPQNVTGGDVRVAAITTREGSNSYQVRYKYTVPNSATGNAYYFSSTGVIAKEPPFLGRFAHPSDGLADYPNTPVLYSLVTVLRGLFRNNDDADYETREVYSFYTPSSGAITETAPDWDKQYPAYGGFAAWLASSATTVDVGKIGQAKKVEIFNQRGERELATEFTYASSVTNADALLGQGHYTEGVLNTERVKLNYRINRSTKTYVPAVLVGSQSTRNNLTISNSNVLYDFFTGQVLESSFTNSAGKVVHSRVIPAYTLPGNATMGAKGDNASNQHMLTQPGATYTYQEVPGYSATTPLTTSHMLSANVQTWQKTWTNYREADASGIYQDVTGQVPVWRQAASYRWQYAQLNTDGSYKYFAPFTWTGTPDSHWLKTGEVVRYDHYSHPVESRDVNGAYASQKTGYGQSQIIAAGTNARYTELAYSGAEDPLTVAGATHFGGEVVAGAGGSLDNMHAHTGSASYQAAAGQKGFIYSAQIGRDVDGGKQYRVQVWANSNAPQGKLRWST